ncbi:MAG: peptidoglycan-binding protein [Ancalomicrobiaceae bacterium]|nr:peptidoglycan-binding protein [Ancalomicrobiaceae bacterium]
MMRHQASRDYDYGDEVGGIHRPAGSLPFRLAAAALRNPAVAAGAIACGLGVIAIVVNAIAYQPVRHPSPLFATRAVPTAGVVPVTTTKIVPPPAASPNVAAAEPHETSIEQAISTNSVPPPKPRPADGPVVSLPPAAVATPPVAGISTQLAERIQQGLKDRGLYTGAIDGIAGPATAEAVKAFERSQGLAPTGEVNEHVAQLLRSDKVRQPVAAVPVRPVAATQPQPMPQAQPVPPEPLTATNEGRLQRVQRALNVAGYGPVRTDGRFDAATSAAIRQYESEHTLPQTGQLSNRLIQDLFPQSAQAR